MLSASPRDPQIGVVELRGHLGAKPITQKMVGEGWIMAMCRSGRCKQQRKWLEQIIDRAQP